MSLASVARMTCLMSLLTYMFGRNLIPLFCNRVGKIPWVAFRYSFTHLPTDSPSMGFLWARLGAGLN